MPVVRDRLEAYLPAAAEHRLPSLCAKQACSLFHFSRLKARWAHRLKVYVPVSSERNSERVRASSLNAPRRQDVFMIEFCFSTPRIIMQRCFASTTTATPFGSRQFINDSAICVVRFS